MNRAKMAPNTFNRVTSGPILYIRAKDDISVKKLKTNSDRE